MKFKGILIGEASGSVGSNTFSHNRGGQYVRQRAVPVNPNSSQQQNVRNSMSLLTTRWVTTLTQVQRDTWAAYAAAVLLPDSLGEPRNIGGLAMYCRNNIPRRQASIAIVNTAPAELTLGELTAPTPTITASSGSISLVFDNTDEWAIAVGGALLFYTSRGQNATRTANQGGYRYAGKVSGAVVPPTSPATLTAAFAVVAGQRVFWQARAVTADGKLSAAIRGSTIAI